MADEYRLRLEGERWSIIDEATLEPVRLDGVPFATMEAIEAQHMLKILKGVDRVRKASKRSASIVKKGRFKTLRTPCVQSVTDTFAPLRPPGADCSLCLTCSGSCMRGKLLDLLN
ncbi:hypothetical protein B5K06_31435 [Rhizobium grahamii]|uniref:Uncharacterized protein n=1 Tax=Rhizobium grahamii TaxID=1120045 RepID=A0A370KFA8_9HYPH|nr:hypothetical protein B5K06_31435 [Rhizobium grahamii]